MSAQARARATPLAQKTMAKFLGAAEEVFGKHGYEGSTIRAIAKKARVNLGTLQHYWGSKRALFRDLFERRFGPLHAEHLRRLQAVAAAAVGETGRPDIREVLRALLEPTLLIGSGEDSPYGSGTQSAAGRKRFRALYGRALMDPSPHVVAEMNRIFERSIKLFLTLMRQACPELTVAELDWRVNCIIGAQVFALMYSERVGKFFGKEADVDDACAVDWILHFILNGVNAPPYTLCNDPATNESRERPNEMAVARNGGRIRPIRARG
jgi:AcrR family transcriptional regulator